MKKILNKKFFERNALIVAPELLGKYLVISRSSQEKEVKKIEAYMITEVEAYDGIVDRASHASKGRTPRTEVMFGEAGVFYIYLIYGMYYMLNVVTDKKDYPSAVLIRGIKSLKNKNRNLNGPGKLTKKLGITKEYNLKKAHKKTGLWFEDRGEKIDKDKIKKTPRIGVDYAGPLWSKKDYRFILEENEKDKKKNS